MRTETAAHQEGGNNASLGENAWRQRRLIWFPNLNTNEGTKEYNKQYNQGNNAAIVPLKLSVTNMRLPCLVCVTHRIHGATPLKSQT